MSEYMNAAFDQIVNWMLPGGYLISDKTQHQKNWFNFAAIVCNVTIITVSVCLQMYYCKSCNLLLVKAS